ncbi:hypothetical protein LTR84_006231 [Exophiala bonariae]|uniref:Alpha/beta hydrolase fold-3 domain-containing protein n=1 Tax=Exophiala bonariae TaxID=1690606 RepID=A0AAV9N5L9_9EURO|nr:hypothetical protein LTR84_006231 [Exophiala bonariae]
MAVPATPAQALGPSIHQISFTEKLDLPLGLISVLGTAIYTALTAPFRGESGAYRFGQHVSTAVVRKVYLHSIILFAETSSLASPPACSKIQYSATTVGYLYLAFHSFILKRHRYVGEPFGKVYEKWAQQNNVPVQNVKLKSGVNAFWLGDHKTAKYIVVYFHGGGFSLDGEDTHFKFWNTVHTDLESTNVTVATLFLEYTLVPHATYPTQIREAVEAVNYVLADLKRPASDIILAGDSAGGNMALAVLSHIAHPSPDLPPISLSANDKLKALVLIAPWTSFRLDFPSADRNKYKDIVSPYAGSTWSKDYMGGKETSPYAEALNAPDGWWTDARVEQLLAVAGADELLVDPIKEWFAKYEAVNPSTSTLVVAPHEHHIEPIMTLRWGNTTETEQGKAIKSWLKSKL